MSVRARSESGELCAAGASPVRGKRRRARELHKRFFFRWLPLNKTHAAKGKKGSAENPAEGVSGRGLISATKRAIMVAIALQRG